MRDVSYAAVPAWIYIVLAAAVLTVLIVVLYERHKTRKTLNTIDAMLDDAISGAFLENTWDESMLSSVEAKLARYLASAESSARNLREQKAKIEALVADISHQTKTPIANILLYAQLLEEQALSEEAKPLTAALTGQSEKLKSLIEALVKTSRLETGILHFQPRLSPIYPMLAETVKQYAPRAEAKQITLSLEPTEAQAVFDPKWTAEAIGNLLDNAVKYTPAGGAVAVRVMTYDMFCRIDVSDTGPGIPEDERAKVFLRFYRSPTVFGAEGVGLGLYLARQIVVGQGGYIKIADSEGSGTTFSVFLPCS